MRVEPGGGEQATPVTWRHSLQPTLKRAVVLFRVHFAPVCRPEIRLLHV